MQKQVIFIHQVNFLNHSKQLLVKLLISQALILIYIPSLPDFDYCMKAPLLLMSLFLLLELYVIFLMPKFIWHIVSVDFNRIYDLILVFCLILILTSRNNFHKCLENKLTDVVNLTQYHGGSTPKFQITFFSSLKHEIETVWT